MVRILSNYTLCLQILCNWNIHQGGGGDSGGDSGGGGGGEVGRAWGLQ